MKTVTKIPPKPTTVYDEDGTPMSISMIAVKYTDMVNDSTLKYIDSPDFLPLIQNFYGDCAGQIIRGNSNYHRFSGHADKEFAFVHNGVLYNDTALRKEYQLPKTNIETDSYVAVQLIPTTLTDFPPEQMWVMDMINAILIEVLGSIAENERMKIRKRQREGIDAAMKKNIKFGRPNIDKPDNWDAVINQVENKTITISQALNQLNISRSSFYRLRRNNQF